MQMALFVWEVETREMGTDYFKSLNLKNICQPLTQKKREKLALAIRDGIAGEEDAVPKEVGGSVRGNEYTPPSKKRLFSDGNPKV